MKIVIGIARGLTYFHTELDPPFTISALNSSAVYLTDDFSPKVYAEPTNMTLLTFSFIYALGLCLNLEFMVGFFKLIFPFLLLYFVLLLPKDSYKKFKK